MEEAAESGMPQVIMYTIANSSKKVGIGTSSTGAKLDVEVTSGGAATIGSSTNIATGDNAVADR